MKKIVLLLAWIGMFQVSFSQVGINTTSPNAQLDIKSSNQTTPSNTDGILIPKIDAFPVTNPTAAQQGMMVYLTTVSSGKQPGFYYWDNTGTPQWKGFGSDFGWGLTGNTGTNPTTNFIGTIDSVDVVFKRNAIVSGKIGGTSTSFGFESLSDLSVGNNNTAFGSQSMYYNTVGVENVAVGRESLFANNSGNLNTAIGFRALSNSNAADNTAIGGNALITNMTGTSNVAVGVESLFNNFDGNNNTAIGREALQQNSDGQNNTALGYASGSQIISGSNNTSLGANAQVPIPSASNQLSIANTIYGTGTNSGLTSKIGINEPAPSAKLQINASSQANPNNTDGIIIPKVDTFPIINPTAAQNGMMVFLTTPASQSGFYYWDNPTSTWKGIGSNTGWGLNGNTATLSNFIGTTSATDLFFKRNSINSGRIAEHNTAFGFNCLNPFNSGLYNVAFGVNALAANSSGINNTAYGDGALRKNTTGGENSAYGSDALRDNLLGSDNIANGFFAMSDNTNANKNIAIGRYALRNQNFSNSGVAFDTNNIAIGIEALKNNNPTTSINGINNIALGNYALGINTIGHKNVAVGNNALQQNTQGVDNVGMGYFCLEQNTNGISNTSVGNYSLEYGNASNNTALGYYALNHIGGNNNSAMGYFSMGAGTMGPGNTSQGAYSLLNVSGTYNTALGFRAGDDNTSGNYNISIGANSDVVNPAGDYQMSIGNVLYGEAMGNLITARFSIGDVPSVSNKFYTYSQQLTANGDGQSTIYGYRNRDSRNDGINYSRTGTNKAVSGYNFWGDSYTFGVTGHCDNDNFRSGGVLGSVTNGVYWSSLGYLNSAGAAYGVYATAALATGTGRMVQSQSNFSIGGGFYGDIMGSWSKGTVIGHVSSGSLVASYNSGDEYTAGRQLEIVETTIGKKAVFTMTSTESVIYKKGKIALHDGTAHVAFDADYAQLLGDIPVVTTTPMGQCNGIYIESVDKTGFTIRELNNGTSSVMIAWIAVGDRVDATKSIATELLKQDFDSNINEVMFNENDKDNKAKAIWTEGEKINFGQLPENLIEKPVKTEDKK